MKLLLYCTKAKPYLNDYRLMEGCNQFVVMSKPLNCLNGKIVAECDFEVEEIRHINLSIHNEYRLVSSMDCFKLYNQSCLYSYRDINNYLKGKKGYAIHIKNLHIFDEPKELEDCIAVKEIKINSYLNKCSFYKLKKHQKICVIVVAMVKKKNIF